MRIVIHEYAEGGRYVFETTDEGDLFHVIEGQRQPGHRIRAAVEVQCDNNEEGRNTLLEALRRVPDWVKAANAFIGVS